MAKPILIDAPGMQDRILMRKPEKRVLERNSMLVR